MNDQNSNEQASGDKGGMLDSIMGSNDKASSGGGQQSGGANSTEDKVLNEGVNAVASEEGIPSVMDGAIDKQVDQEAGKFL